MSADENISVSIQDSEIDAAIQKLNVALTKKEQLTTAVNGSPQGYSGERDSGVIINSSVEAESAKIDVAQKQLSDFQSSVEAESAKIDVAQKQLSDFQNTTDSVTSKVKTLLAGEGRKIKGVETSANRIIRMIPGLREANRLRRGIRQLSVLNISGAVTILMLALRIYRQVASMMEEQKRQQEEYKRSVMEIRGFTTSAQFEAWQKQQRHLQEAYRSGIIP